MGRLFIRCVYVYFVWTVFYLNKSLNITLKTGYLKMVWEIMHTHIYTHGWAHCFFFHLYQSRWERERITWNKGKQPFHEVKVSFWTHFDIIIEWNNRAIYPISIYTYMKVNVENVLSQNLSIFADVIFLISTLCNVKLSIRWNNGNIFRINVINSIMK